MNSVYKAGEYEFGYERFLRSHGEVRHLCRSIWTVHFIADQDRVTDAGELRTLTEAGVVSIGTGNVWDGSLNNGNLMGETGSAVLADGSSVAVVDVYFATK